MTVSERLRGATGELTATSETPRLDAELLMAHALRTSRSEMLLRHMVAPVPDGFEALLERRKSCEPIAYILGSQAFFGLEFLVDPAVLIPRPDSEVLVEKALECRPDARRVLDCGTGSGALLLSVLHALPHASGVGTDRSAQAMSVARQNAARLGLAERARMVLADWDRSDWTVTLDGPFDLILANPPYVEAAADLAADVRDYEPSGALFAGPDGVDAYRALIPQLPALLTPGGVILMEIGADQAERVSAIAQTQRLTSKLHRDLAQRPRVLQFSAAW